jgi:2-aminoadipate transaminase
MHSAVRLSQAARRAGDSPISDLMARALACPDLISLAAGFVDHGTLPVAATAEAVRSVLGDPLEGRRALQYGTTRGDSHLRQRLLRLVENQDGVAEGSYASALERLIVTSGSQQLLYLLAEVLLDPGDIVLVESPTYFVFLGVLRARGARVVGVEVDDGGMRIDSLEERLAEIDRRGELGRVKMIYTVSEHSNPTGLSLEAERRGALVRVASSWSRQGRIYVVEDAAYRGLAFDGADPRSIWSHDETGQTVILARTFSKTYSPGLKIGYGILPEELVRPVLALKGHHDFGSTHFAQQLLERVVADGHYQRQIELLRTTYRAKCEAILAALDAELGGYQGDVHWTTPGGGIYVWLTLPETVDTGREGRFFAACLDEGVLYVPGEYAFPDEPSGARSHHARLSFGVCSPEALAEGVRRLARALRREWGRHGERAQPARRVEPVARIAAGS